MGQLKGRKGTAWKREIKADDVFLSDPRESDMVVPIMGPSGSGKSTFINILIGQEVASVGHELQSHTAYIQHFTLLHPDYPNRRIVIIDTPGFDDSDIDDREILRRIAVWLARSYDARMRLAGIIYLHEITQPRMLGTSRKNLDMFTRLCGPEAIKNVILITTKWDELSSEGIGKLRESQLKGEHWKHMVEMGSRVHRFDGTQRLARRIVNYILAKQPIDAVQIQTELVQIGDLLAETEAGRTLRYTLQDLLKKQKAMSTKMRNSSEGDPSMHEKALALENEEKIRHTLKQIKELNIPLSRKITKFLGLVVGVIIFSSDSYQ
ncbi:hypothetical protein C0992_000958 [Termitomyces sp. T32_za158]|nr:hypothetical protein C0992_000958 [Termitomyces sp. T32_za158]